MSYCTNCGTENPDTSGFCGKCGQPLSSEIKVVTPQICEQKVLARKSRNTPLIISGVVVFIVLVAVLLALGWSFLLKPMSASDYEKTVKKEYTAMRMAWKKLDDVRQEMWQLSEGDESDALDKNALANTVQKYHQALQDLEKHVDTLKGLRAPKRYQVLQSSLREYSAAIEKYLIPFYQEIDKGLPEVKTGKDWVALEDGAQKDVPKQADEDINRASGHVYEEFYKLKWKLGVN